MLTPSLAANLPRALGLLQAATIQPGQTAPISGLVRTLLPVLEALQKQGIGSTALQTAVNVLKGEDSVRGPDLPAEYSSAALGTLMRELRGANLERLLDNQPEMVEAAVASSFSDDDLAARADELDRLLAGLATSPGPTIIVRRPRARVDARRVLVTVGDPDPEHLDVGEALTPFGPLDTTWQAATRNRDVVAFQARDAGFVRWAGREGGRDQWVRRSEDASLDGRPVTVDEIDAEWGDWVRARAGVRDLPRSPAVEGLVADFGGWVPEYMREGLMTAMGLDSRGLKGSPFENQRVFLRKPGLHAKIFLFAALRAFLALGAPPSRFVRARDFGISYATAFDGYDQTRLLLDATRSHVGPSLTPEQAVDRVLASVAAAGGTTLDEEALRRIRGEVMTAVNAPGKPKQLAIMQDPFLSFMLANMAPGVVANMIGPAGDFRALGARGVYDKVVGRPFDPRRGADTLGAFSVEKGACASGAAALHIARKFLRGDSGEVPPGLMLVGSADTSLEPLDEPVVSKGFAKEAPMSRERLRQLGLSPAQASRPFMSDAGGLVCAEGAGAVMVTSLYNAIRWGLPYTGVVVGSGQRLGQGGKAHESGVNDGIINVLMDIFKMAFLAHGYDPQDFTTVLAHGTSTGPSNIEEPKALWTVLHALGYQGQMDLYASKGLMGHTMGASSMIDLLLGLMIMSTGVVPGLHNFDPDKMDPRITDPGNEHNAVADFRQHLLFSPETRAWRRGGVIGVSEGFGSTNAGFGVMPADPENDMERYPGISAAMRADYRSKRTASEAERREMFDRYRRGQISHREVAAWARYL